MAVKPIIDIDVNDEKFRQFNELFQKYQAQVRSLPGAWGSVNKEMQAGFETMTAALLASISMNKRARDATEDTANQSRRVASTWKDAAASTGTFANNIHRATMDFLRWTGAIEAVGGIIGIGGLWGLDKLAGSVGSGRRQDQGLNITQGQRVAFGLNYGRITDPNAFLGDVNAAAHDPAQVSRLYAAGLSEQDVSGKDTGQLAVALMDKYKELVDHTDKSLLGAVVRAHGGLISTEDAVRLKSLSTSEYGDIRSQTLRDQSTMNLGDPMMKAWQDFQVQLSRAGMNIENAFVVGLTPLIPQLTRFSGVVTGLVTDLMKWADQSHAIDKLGDGIKSFGDYLTSKDFHDDLEMFKGDIIALAGAIHKGLGLLGIIPDKPDTSTAEGRAKAADPNAKGNVFQRFKSEIDSQNPELTSKWSGLLPAIQMAESGRTGGFNKDGSVLISPKGARGAFQLMPKTASGLGVNPDNYGDARHGAALLLDQLSAHYQGDPVKMLAAYNWSPSGKFDKKGNPLGVDADVSRYGADWMKHLPRETAKYIRDVLRDPNAFLVASKNAMTPAVRVEILNATGSNVIVSTLQAAR